MRILVTGANGYLGRGIVKQLLDMGETVVAADFDTDFVDKRAERICCNIFEEENPFLFFHEPDVLLHMAWRDGFVHYSANHMYDLPFHYCFIKKFVDAGIKRIAVMGSMHEIGFYEGSIKEDTPCNPVSLYGISKNALRGCCFMLAQNAFTQIQWLRGYYIVGNSRHGSSVFSKIAAAVDCGEKEFPFTMGQNQFDFIEYEEFCRQSACAVCQDKVLGIINICSGYPEKLADRVEKFIADNQFSIKLKYGVFPDRPYDSVAVWGDNAKIRRIMQNNEKEECISSFI